MTARVKWKPLSPMARKPTKGHEKDSGYDLYAVVPSGGDMLWPGETRKFYSDVGVRLPDDFEAQIRPRSSLNDRGILCGWGTVDELYVGNLGITLTNTTREPYPVKNGDRIAQVVFVRKDDVVLDDDESDDLGETSRGTAGFGSTGR